MTNQTPNPAGIALMNPLKEARYILGLSQQEVADYTGNTRNVVLRTEQAVYSDPSPSIVEFYAHRLPADQWSLSLLIQGYHDYQAHRRAVAGSRLPQDIRMLVSEADPLERHPLVRIRAAMELSQIGFCVEFCVNPGPIHKYERWQQRAMPAQLHRALSQAGCSQVDFLDKFAQLRYDRIHDAL